MRLTTSIFGMLVVDAYCMYKHSRAPGTNNYESQGVFVEKLATALIRNRWDVREVRDREITPTPLKKRRIENVNSFDVDTHITPIKGFNHDKVRGQTPKRFRCTTCNLKSKFKCSSCGRGLCSWSEKKLYNCFNEHLKSFHPQLEDNSS